MNDFQSSSMQLLNKINDMRNRTVGPNMPWRDLDIIEGLANDVTDQLDIAECKLERIADLCDPQIEIPI